MSAVLRLEGKQAYSTSMLKNIYVALEWLLPVSAAGTTRRQLVLLCEDSQAPHGTKIISAVPCSIEGRAIVYIGGNAKLVGGGVVDIIHDARHSHGLLS